MKAACDLPGPLRIALIASGTYFSSWTKDEVDPLANRLPEGDVVDIYELADRQLDGYRCMFIDHMADQEFLYRHKDVIWNYLQGGNVVVFCGHQCLPWLPGAGLFVPLERGGVKDFKIKLMGTTPHPIFSTVSAEELTYRKGVAGFFARGYHPAPSEAEVLITLPGDAPVTYIDRRSTNGTLLVHAGGALWGQGEPMDKVREQLLHWLADECVRIDERGQQE
ncbi:hypothetical protein [Paenibacillus sanguinis]|uniref:hypothetical protein n=1 Tax=Paenibacillus sanguinis TaxID=225906 RepID=UPI00036F9193|nr:hypothetical protein [Paenibacillus sanguinis]